MSDRSWRVERRGAALVVVDPGGQEDGACGQFLDRLLLRGLSLNTVEAYAYDLVLLRRWLDAEHLQLDAIDSEHLHRFLAWERGRNSSPKSINRRLHTLRLFFRHATERELPGGTVVRTGRKTRADHEFGLQRVLLSERRHLRVKEPKTVVEPLTIEQVNELLTNFRRYRDLGIAHLMLLCGLRSQEVLNLRLSDVDADDRRLKIRGKGGKERSVPAPTLLLNLLSKYVELERPADDTQHLFLVLQGTKRGKPLTRSGLRRIFRTRRERPSLANANPHRLRHTFGTDMARSGVRLPILQRMMGHAFAVTTLQYVSLSMVDVAAEFHRAAKVLEQRYDLGAGEP